MTDQPARRPEYPGPDYSGAAPQPNVPPSGYEPPRFVPPYGSEAQNQGGSQYPGNQYPENHYGGDQYGGNPYGQPAGAYPQQAPYGQPASPYGQPASPYGQPAYYGMPAEPKTLSIASMVCGIASVIMGWLLLPQIAAIVTGHMALKREPSGKGMSITGLVLGYLCLLGYGAFWLLLIIGLAYAGTTSTNTF
ncbi:DUF4190 domain-containing protein [Arthrobacter sp. RT-1]|uniref:DUF4190 domain-containing protein n=1 Tax=Arthrobacter sp. RT-1 TaxID=2292263 RepID=UPI000E1EBD5C|nr:DUF4190 domain-containing protein [Arthrobacter sp. RT-1]RDV10298.1 DUF4190 domain-containing protein [Arthrobacter sp. RT-1]